MADKVNEVKTSQSSEIDVTTGKVSAVTNTTIATSNGLFTREMPSIIQHHMEMQMCSSPWGVTFLNKDGELDAAAQKRWDEVISVHWQWNQFPSRLVKALSLNGIAHATLNWLEGGKKINEQFPYLILANGAPMYIKIGNTVKYAQVIQQITQGTIPIISTTEYWPDKIKWSGYELGASSPEKMTLGKATDIMGLNLPKGETKTPYEFVPVYRFLNKDGDTQQETALSDMTPAIYGLCSYLDFLYEQLIAEIQNNTTWIKSVGVQSGWTMTTPQGRASQRALIDKEVQNKIRQFQASSDYADGDLFEIMPMTPQVSAIRQEFNETIMMISFMFGGVPMLDRMGSYQMTNSQSHTSGRNSGEYIINKKLMLIKPVLLQMIQDMIVIEEKNGIKDWINVDNILIDITINEAGKEFQMSSKPQGFLAAGWRLITMIRQQQKVTTADAIRIAKEAEKDISKYPNLAKLWGIKDENGSKGDNEPGTKLPNSNTQIKENDSGE